MRRPGDGTRPVEAELWLTESPVTPGSEMWRRVVADRSALAGMLIVGALAVVALLEPLLVPRSPIAERVPGAWCGALGSLRRNGRAGG